MASVRKVIDIDASPEQLWAAVKDVGAVHQRLARGFVTDVRLEHDARVVTFANGFVVRELIVTIDDGNRRLVYAAVGGRTTHHNASMQVCATGQNRSRLIWIADLLPDEVAPAVEAMMEQGCQAMRATLGVE